MPVTQAPEDRLSPRSGELLSGLVKREAFWNHKPERGACRPLENRLWFGHERG